MSWLPLAEYQAAEPGAAFGDRTPPP
jgi:hypothetical protein